MGRMKITGLPGKMMMVGMRPSVDGVGEREGFIYLLIIKRNMNIPRRSVTRLMHAYVLRSSLPI